jgi:hypothetical protein
MFPQSKMSLQPDKISSRDINNIYANLNFYMFDISLGHLTNYFRWHKLDKLKGEH